MVLYQIMRPAAYRTIDHPEKWKFDWAMPAILSLVSLVLLWLLRDLSNYYGSSGLIAKVTSFVQILPGFYIAALAAIATFNKSDIDQYLPDPKAKVDIMIGGQKNTIDLTRRRFLCMLFAFLTAESLLIAVVSIAATTFSGAMYAVIPAALRVWVSMAFLFVYVFLFWQMLVATFLGLYYLGDRLHQPEA